MLEKIKGKSTKEDMDIVRDIHKKTEELKRIDDTRIAAVDSAYEYVNNKYIERAVAFGSASIIIAFGFGVAVTTVLWYIITNFMV